METKEKKVKWSEYTVVPYVWKRYALATYFFATVP